MSLHTSSAQPPEISRHGIAWNDSFSLGIRTLDEHHRHLASLINRLMAHPSAETNTESFTAVVSELVQYARYHFEHEEALMAEHDYPASEHHRNEHDQFCRFVSETSYGAMIGVITKQHLVDYLVRWWQAHILSEDMLLKPFFASKGIR